MRRKRFQRGSLKPRERNGRKYWYGQWREEGRPKSKELGLCSQVPKWEAEEKLAAILQSINAVADKKPLTQATFQRFVESVYLPTQKGHWKGSTNMNTEQLIRSHLVPTLGPRLQSQITRTELQELLNSKARRVSTTLRHSVVEFSEDCRLSYGVC